MYFKLFLMGTAALAPLGLAADPGDLLLLAIGGEDDSGTSVATVDQLVAGLNRPPFEGSDWVNTYGLNGPRRNFASASIPSDYLFRDSILIAGGTNENAGSGQQSAFASVEELNQLRPRWRFARSGNLALARRDAACAPGRINGSHEQDGTVFVAGGYSITGAHLSSVERWFGTEAANGGNVEPYWSSVPDMPIARAKAAAAAIKQRLFIFGGETSTPLEGTALSSSVIYFDPDAKCDCGGCPSCWIEVSPMPEPRHSHGAVSISVPGSEPWVAIIGGTTRVSGSPPVIGVNTVPVYDMATDSWGALPPMQTKRTSAASAQLTDVRGTFIIVAGGYAFNSDPSVFSFVSHTSVEMYTVEGKEGKEGSWTFLTEMNSHRRGFGLEVVRFAEAEESTSPTSTATTSATTSGSHTASTSVSTSLSTTASSTESETETATISTSVSTTGSGSISSSASFSESTTASTSITESVSSSATSSASVSVTSSASVSATSSASTSATSSATLSVTSTVSTSVTTSVSSSASFTASMSESTTQSSSASYTDSSTLSSSVSVTASTTITKSVTATATSTITSTQSTSPYTTTTPTSSVTTTELAYVENFVPGKIVAWSVAGVCGSLAAGVVFFIFRQRRGIAHIDLGTEGPPVNWQRKASHKSLKAAQELRTTEIGMKSGRDLSNFQSSGWSEASTSQDYSAHFYPEGPGSDSFHGDIGVMSI